MISGSLLPNAGDLRSRGRRGQRPAPNEEGTTFSDLMRAASYKTNPRRWALLHKEIGQNYKTRLSYGFAVNFSANLRILATTRESNPSGAHSDLLLQVSCSSLFSWFRLLIHHSLRSFWKVLKYHPSHSKLAKDAVDARERASASGRRLHSVRTA